MVDNASKAFSIRQEEVLLFFPAEEFLDKRLKRMAFFYSLYGC